MKQELNTDGQAFTPDPFPSKRERGMARCVLRFYEPYSIRQPTGDDSPSPVRRERAGVEEICNTIVKLRAPTANIWSAMTCHRFVRRVDLSARQSRVQRLGEKPTPPLAFDGDNSPTKSADKSAHSKVVAAQAALGSSVSIYGCSQ